MPSVQANIDLKGKPSLQAKMHESKGQMIEVKIQMTAFALLDPDLDVLGLGISNHLKGLARFDAIENGNQSFGDLVAGGNGAGQILFAGLAGRDKDKWPASLLRQRLGLILYRLGGAFDQLAEILDQDTTGV